eukprot:scaffold883_cov325-Pavlova_lutheri.AAC.9
MAQAMATSPAVLALGAAHLLSPSSSCFLCAVTATFLVLLILPAFVLGIAGRFAIAVRGASAIAARACPSRTISDLATSDPRARFKTPLLTGFETRAVPLRNPPFRTRSIPPRPRFPPGGWIPDQVEAKPDGLTRT